MEPGADILDQVVSMDLERIVVNNSAVFFVGQMVLVTLPHDLDNIVSVFTIAHVHISKKAKDEGWISADLFPAYLGVGSYLIVTGG